MTLRYRVIMAIPSAEVGMALGWRCLGMTPRYDSPDGESKESVLGLSDDLLKLKYLSMVNHYPIF